MAVAQLEEDFGAVHELGRIDPVVALGHRAQLGRDLDPVLLDPPVILGQRAHERDELGVAAVEQRRKDERLFHQVVFAHRTGEEGLDGAGLGGVFRAQRRVLHPRGERGQPVEMAPHLRMVGIQPGEVGVGGFGFHRVLLHCEYAFYTPPEARRVARDQCRTGQDTPDRPKRVRSS